MLKQSLLEALQTKVHPSSQYMPQEDVSAELAGGRQKLLDQPCPQCGEASVICCYVDLSVGQDPHNYYDNFCHVCINADCSYGVHVEYRSMVGQETKEDQVCPFCHRDVGSDP